MPLFLLSLTVACHCPKADPSAPEAPMMSSGESTLWLRVEPTEVEVAPGGAFTFRPNLNYPKGRAYLRPPVKWSVQEAAGGAIDAMGHYTAPASTGVFHVLVERTDVDGVRAVATVTVK
ncbi:MAG TPA: hypothetical protein VL181_03105 [Holophagaceae bacterium]|nr:hypothetical protein [Holophagaceae bacterium]